MVKLICKASKLRDDYVMLKSKPIGSRMCTLCEVHVAATCRDDAVHMVMQCLSLADRKKTLSEQVEMVCNDINPEHFIGVVMGKCVSGWSIDSMTFDMTKVSLALEGLTYGYMIMVEQVAKIRQRRCYKSIIFR